MTGGCRIFCCGNAPMPNSISRPACGPISAKKNSPPRSRIFTPASAPPAWCWRPDDGVLMRILLINIPHPSIGSRIPDDHLPPLGLLSIGGPLLDDGHDVT